MSGFRAGKYDRSRLGVFKHLSPIQSVHNLTDIEPADLVKAGKKLVLVDVDNTLVEWHSEHIPVSTAGWLAIVKAAGLKVCIISNTKKIERLRRLAKAMDIPFLVGRFKPSRSMFRQALKDFNAKPQEAVMIGDQLFTDVLGANRTHIDAIWVKQMAPKDFIGTKYISRVGERVVRGRLHKVLDPEEEVVTEMEPAKLYEKPAVKQFLKFCVVGGGSTVVDLGLFWLLRFGNHESVSLSFGHWLVANFPGLFGSYSGNVAAASVPVFKTFTTTVAIFNSFLWNRLWTFQIRGKENRRSQFQKFFVVSIIGLILNTVITTFFSEFLPGSTKTRTGIALIVATFAVAFWNFLGQKYWIFKSKD
ncbi:MAG TPA: YqeG family HAD IIIA-type phosphatase [Fimbriimonadaceae bacterium]|jgi:hypothetical protein